jgi:hypothetical protein
VGAEFEDQWDIIVFGGLTSVSAQVVPSCRARKQQVDDR